VRAPILVVDDDADIRETLSDLLEDEGYEVCTAANGRDALAHLTRERGTPPGLILLDLMMPVMDGLSFLDRYAEDRSLPPVPVVAMSANLATSGGSHRKDILLYMTKPLNFERLLETIALWCS
jgi:CheY-like chemotaxis protein